MLIDIDCISVWLTRLAKYIYIDCIVYLWLVVFKDLLGVGKCSVLSRSNVECENCGWQSNASAANPDAGVHSAEVIIQCHDALLSTFHVSSVRMVVPNCKCPVCMYRS